MNENLQYSSAGLDLTEHSESLRLKAYPDPGTGAEPWTIGYGHTGPEVHEGLEIDELQAVAWLKDDIEEAENDVRSLVTVELTQGEYDGLVDFAFNCGRGHLAGSTLLRMVNAKDWMGASQQFDRWVYGGGHILPGLVIRRHGESDLFVGKNDVA